MCMGKLGQVWLDLHRQTEDPGPGLVSWRRSHWGYKAGPLPQPAREKPKLPMGNHPLPPPRSSLFSLDFALMLLKWNTACWRMRLTQTETSGGPGPDTPGPAPRSDPLSLPLPHSDVSFVSAPPPSCSQKHDVNSSGSSLLFWLLPLSSVYCSFLSAQVG